MHKGRVDYAPFNSLPNLGQGWGLSTSGPNFFPKYWPELQPIAHSSLYPERDGAVTQARQIFTKNSVFLLKNGILGSFSA